MGGVYNNAGNIYFSEFREIELTNSGYFYFPDEDARLVTIHNDSNNAIEIAKTTSTTYQSLLERDQYQPASGTAYVEGNSITVEDGMSFQVRGIPNANHVSIRKAVKTAPTLHVKYIIEK